MDTAPHLTLELWTRRQRPVIEHTGDARHPIRVRLKGRSGITGYGATEEEAARHARLSWELRRLAGQR
mgnify:CR=1 FL=1